MTFKEYLAIVRAEMRLATAQREYLLLMAAQGLDGRLPHVFDDDTLTVTLRHDDSPPSAG